MISGETIGISPLEYGVLGGLGRFQVTVSALDLAGLN